MPDNTNVEKIMNNELTEPEEGHPKDDSSVCVDQSEDTEDNIVPECLDAVLVINKHLCHVKQGGESVRGGSDILSNAKQGADIIIGNKLGGDSMADSVTGKSEADSISQVIYCLI